jgi:predicted metal-dependent enzyme (double-stranded beta helix superfamily)
MAEDSLERFVEGVRSARGPLTSEQVENIRRLMEALVKAPATEKWLAELHKDGPENKDLYRDPEDGFMLLAHTESAGRYRPPHDHGRGWVIYAMQRGEVDMGTWIRVQDSDGKLRLVKREPNLLRAGQVKVFLPGDIHDTRTITGPATVLRFADRDLLTEEHEERRLTRFIQKDGVWTVRAA